MQNFLELNIFALIEQLIDWQDLGRAVVAVVTTWLFTLVFRNILLSRLEKLASRTVARLDDVLIASIASIPAYFYFTISIFVGLHFFNLTEQVDAWISAIFFGIILFESARFLQRLIGGIIETNLKNGRVGSKTAANGIKLILQILIWSSAALLLLSNLGFQVSTLIASLGIGGIAVAFALQNILSDIFSSFSLYFDRPFEIGDFVKIGNDAGTIKKIGLKTTRIQTLQGEELVISNNEMTSARIHNFKKMKQRRLTFHFGVEYGTSSTKLKKIPKIIKKIIKTIKSADLQRCHFRSFGDSSLDFETVFLVDTDDYAKSLDIQQGINLRIVEEFEKEKIAMAFPSQTIYLRK